MTVRLSSIINPACEGPPATAGGSDRYLPSEPYADADAALEVVRRLALQINDEEAVARARGGQPPAEADHRVAPVEPDEGLARRVELDDAAEVEGEARRRLRLVAGRGRDDADDAGFRVKVAAREAE